MTRCFGNREQAEKVAECIREAHPEDAAEHMYMRPSSVFSVPLLTLYSLSYFNNAILLAIAKWLPPRTTIARCICNTR